MKQPTQVVQKTNRGWKVLKIVNSAEPAPDRGLWALSNPRLSNPSQDVKEVLLWARKNLGQYSSPSLSPLISHTQQTSPFQK